VTLLELADHVARGLFLLGLAGVGVHRVVVRQLGGWSRVLGWIGACFRARPW
jgi:hypothetical protein